MRALTDSEEQLESFDAQIGRYKRIIQEELAGTWEFSGIFTDTESGTSIDKREEFQDMIDNCRDGYLLGIHISSIKFDFAFRQIINTHSR